MDVLVRRKYSAIVEDVVLVQQVVEGPDFEKDLMQKLNAGHYEYTEECQVTGDESTVEILQIDPKNSTDDVIINKM